MGCQRDTAETTDRQQTTTTSQSRNRRRCMVVEGVIVITWTNVKGDEKETCIGFLLPVDFLDTRTSHTTPSKT